MAVFFVFAMLLGAALQLTNAYGDTFLHDFANVPAFQDAIAVKYPAIIMSISQISETLFILTIPFFLRRFGIKAVMTMSMLAWFLRFGLFAYGDPGDRLWMIVLSCIVRSEEHTSELQSLMRISYAVFCLKKKKTDKHNNKYQNKTMNTHDDNETNQKH